MRESIFSEKTLAILKLGLGQATNLFFLSLSLISFSLPYSSLVRPEFFLMVVFYWAVFRPQFIAPVIIFFAGILMDVFSGFPLGLTAFGLVGVHWVVQRQRLFLTGQSFAGLWLGFLIVVSGFTVYKWIVLSFLAFAILPFASSIMTIIVSCLVFPVAALMLHATHKLLPVD